jgi:hypothetical protein
MRVVFETLIAVDVRITVLWVVTWFGLVNISSSISLETLEVKGITFETSGTDTFLQPPFLLVEMGRKEGRSLEVDRLSMPQRE